MGGIYLDNPRYLWYSLYMDDLLELKKALVARISTKLKSFKDAHVSWGNPAVERLREIRELLHLSVKAGIDPIVAKEFMLSLEDELAELVPSKISQERIFSIKDHEAWPSNYYQILYSGYGDDE